MASADISLNAIGKKLARLDKKMDDIMAYLEDISMTPEEHEKYAKAEGAYAKGKHRKWKTPEALLED